ncbi:MAG TPA: hypothetical protein VM537_21935, partial [Anaerolineae bacterium]|nr:hypothetical protein [Anaerolineae bacterium]
PDFYKSVQRAIDISLREEATAIKTPNAESLKQRIEACYNTLVVMRREMGYSLAKSFDLLPQYFQRALVEGKRPEDLIEAAAGQATAWDKGSKPVPVQVASGPDAEDIEPKSGE